MNKFVVTLIAFLLISSLLTAQNVGIGTVTPNELLHLVSPQSTIVKLEADTDNSVETDQPRIEFLQDGGAVEGVVGYYGGTNHMSIQNNYNSVDADIDFFTSAIQRMTIDGSGKVGIGTTAPTQLLHISSATSAVLVLEADTDNVTETDQPSILFKQDGGGVQGLIGYGGGTNNLLIQNNWSHATGDIEFYTDSVSRMTIDGIGNVGIGTKAPVEKLTVQDGHVGVNNGFGLVQNFGSGSEYGYLPNAPGIKSMTGIGDRAPFDFGTQIRSDALIAFIETDSDKVSGWMDLNSNRFVWNGKISSSEIIVQTDVWADYVFKKGYALKSLEEIDNFIQINGHLPNIPKEKDIVDGGMDLGKLTILQQEKIEELFLHTIEQQKQIEALKEEIKSIKGE